VLELLKARRRQIQKIYVADAQDAARPSMPFEFEAQRHGYRSRSSRWLGSTAKPAPKDIRA